MDIKLNTGYVGTRLNTEPTMGHALRTDQITAWEPTYQKLSWRSRPSTDTFEISEEAAAAQEAETSKITGPSDFEKQWRAERKFGVLRKEDGSADNSETTFFSMLKGLDVYEDYLRSIGRPISPETPCPASEHWINACQIVRDQISQSVQDLLKKNGIEIPEGQSFTLQVTSDYFIHAVGLDDPELTDAVERALNVGNNGVYLFDHIDWCDKVAQEFGLTVPSAADSLSDMKDSLFLMVQDLTGYDIRELERKDGNIYTPDGQNLWDVLLQKAANYKTPDGIISVDISKYWALYSRIAQLGWDCVPDKVLSLTYLDGGLYDIGTKYGYGPGQTGWQAWAHEHADELSANSIRYIEDMIAATKAWDAARAWQ